jgi:hypothetical protein
MLDTMARLDQEETHGSEEKGRRQEEGLLR